MHENVVRPGSYLSSQFRASPKEDTPNAVEECGKKGVPAPKCTGEVGASQHRIGASRTPNGSGTTQMALRMALSGEDGGKNGERRGEERKSSAKRGKVGFLRIIQ